jgi:NADPH:quinone reductase-like Zn-dependent oxidoreductase
MKSYHAHSGGGLASLVAREHPVPQPSPGDVLIRVRANSLNARELSVLDGTYPLPVKPDVVMCADGAGEVVGVGQGVSRVVVGDRVAAAMFPRWIDGPIAPEYAPQIGGSLDGMVTEYVALSEEAIVHVPEHLSFEEDRRPAAPQCRRPGSGRAAYVVPRRSIVGAILLTGYFGGA